MNSSWLAHRNPTIKIAVLFLLSLGTLAVWRPLPAALILAATLLAVRALAQVKTLDMARRLLPFVVFGLGVIMVNSVTRPGTAILNFGGQNVTLEGLSFGTAMALRTLIVGVLSIAFLATTPPRDLMISLHQHAKVSPRYCYAILVGHRILDGLPQQWLTIRAAHQIRSAGGVRGDGARAGGDPMAASVEPRAPKARFTIRDFVRCAFALLVTSIRQAERIALALESRGLGAGTRTVWKPVALTATDWIFGAFALGSYASLLVIALSF